MTSIIGIPTTRISNTYIQQRLLSQVQYDQTELFRLQTQLSTGRRFEAPSEDPVASMRIIDIQRLIERKEQVAGNVETNQSYLRATDVALSDISGLVAEVRGTALGALGTTATDIQRQAAAQQVGQMIQQLVDTGNQKFRGRYLFAGSATQVRPFDLTDSGAVAYLGNQDSVESYADLNYLFKTNMTGDEAFGAVSTVVEGTEDLQPVVLYDTRLADTYGGQGISSGSISVAAGGATSVIDISSAETIGDIAQLLVDNPPPGSTMQAEITPRGFKLQLASGGTFTISDVGGGTVAQELGILEETGATTVTSSDLDPALRITTELDDAFGARAQAVVRSIGDDNDIVVHAPIQGAAYNNVNISFVNTAVAGSETATYNSGPPQELIVSIEAGKSNAADIVIAINRDTLFTAQVDPLDDVDGGEGIVDPAAVATTAYGSGKAFDKTSGLQIVNDETTSNISFATAETVEDMLNLLNGIGSGLMGEINADKTEINIHSRISGADFTIGENGGTTAADLGVRSFTTGVTLDELNFGNGVNTHAGTDFTITRADGVELDIDLDTASNIQDVIDLINTNPLNVDGPLAPGVVTARLAAYGNGIELVDDSLGSGTLTVARSQLSTAAIDLGLIPEGEEEATAGTVNVSASRTLNLAGPNNDLRFNAQFPGTYGNVNIIFEDTGMGADSCTYDAVAKTLTFEITAGTTDANNIITLLGGSPAAGLFTAGLSTDDPGNTGAGTVPATDVWMTNGQAEVLTGDDPNPQETKGLFTALLRLREALQANDVLEAQRSIELLDDGATDLNFSRAELGARQQSL
ncbi:MAG: flagellar hook-associated protein FlgL, partial [Planctomycetota bacterium]|nr:flagellar hook-associated protein FlgL [Planctomycetota bacterium]